jgi:hypothetical protein
VARIELRVVEDPQDPDRRLLLPVKNNLAAAPGLAYRIQSGDNGAGFAVWEEGTVDITIGEVEADGSDGDQSTIGEVVEWLQGFLSEGRIKASEIKKQSLKEGFSWITVKRAKKKLEVVAKQLERAWWWSLPEGSQGTSNSEEIGSDNPSESDSTFVF